MVLKDIMAISGEAGLFRFIAQGKNAIIVEHLETKKRSSAFASTKVSSLEEISIFTEKEDMPLAKVFDLIFEKEKGGPALDYKSDPGKLKSYFGEVLPEYDKERVYISDIKKIFHWYNILHALNLLVKEEPVKTSEPDVAEVKETTGEEKSSKGSTSKKEKPASEKDQAAPKKKPSKQKEK
jgi:hypothetical protein